MYVTDIDECLTSPCMNNGTCFNSYGGYYCRCPKGWIGDNCLQGKSFYFCFTSFEVSGGEFDDNTILIFDLYMKKQ